MVRTCRHCEKTSLETPFYDDGRSVCKACKRKDIYTRRTAVRLKGLCIECSQPAPDGPLCSACREVHRLRHHDNKVEYNRKARERRQRLKMDVFNAYGGPRCACCGEDHAEFLTIDHIDQNGAQHRRSLQSELAWAPVRGSMCGATFYLWLKKNNYPSGFRVLCFNCNFAIGHFGKCPHQG